MSPSAIILLVGLAIFSADTFAVRNCTRENEENKCGSACQTTCSNLGKPCLIQNVKCNDTCYCKDGFARIMDDNNSTCIPIKECPCQRGRARTHQKLPRKE